jgi:hypothetical protein
MLVDRDVAQAPPPGVVRMRELGAHRICPSGEAVTAIEVCASKTTS